MYNCIQLPYSTQHRTVLIIFTLHLQTHMIAVIQSAGGADTGRNDSAWHQISNCVETWDDVTLPALLINEQLHNKKPLKYLPISLSPWFQVLERFSWVLPIHCCNLVSVPVQVIHAHITLMKMKNCNYEIMLSLDTYLTGLVFNSIPGHAGRATSRLLQNRRPFCHLCCVITNKNQNFTVYWVHFNP